MRWLITGGCGFIGTSLIKTIIQNHENRVRVIDNLSVGKKSDLAAVCEFEQIEVSDLDSSTARCQLILGDILDERLAIKIAKDIDVIVHLAANTGVGPSVEDPRRDCQTNVFGILNYLEAARINNVKRFVFASSGAPVGEVEPPIHEEIAPHPVSPYGASKLAGEGYCSAYSHTFKIETVALRFSNVYGPGSHRKNSVVAKFIQRALKKEPLEIYGDGTQTRDFIYIDDLVAAIVLAVTKENIGGETFQIATNSETTLNEMVKLMKTAFKLFNINLPDIVYTDSRLGDVKRNYSDVSKANKLLGWSGHTALDIGLEKTIDWFLSL